MNRRAGRRGREGALDDRGARPLTRGERSVLAALERELRPPCTPHRGATGERRLARVAGAVGILLLGGMIAEAALAGGTVLALAVAAVFLVLVLVFAVVVHGAA